MDGEICSLENCELNHHNIYYMLKYELDNSTELENKVSESKPESCEGIVKQIDDSKKLLMEGKADTEIAGDSPKRQSLDRELVDQKENQSPSGAVYGGITSVVVTATFFVTVVALLVEKIPSTVVSGKNSPNGYVSLKCVKERTTDQQLKPVSMASKFVSKEASCGIGRIADSISREGSVPNIKAENSTSTEDGAPRSLASLFAMQNTEKLSDHEEKNLVVSATKQCHDNISIRSSSTNSTKSFAFPVLISEWVGSPVKMMEADKREFKRRRCCWRMCFDFCRF